MSIRLKNRTGDAVPAAKASLNNYKPKGYGKSKDFFFLREASANRENCEICANFALLCNPVYTSGVLLGYLPN